MSTVRRSPHPAGQTSSSVAQSWWGRGTLGSGHRQPGMERRKLSVAGLRAGGANSATINSPRTLQGVPGLPLGSARRGHGSRRLLSTSRALRSKPSSWHLQTPTPSAQKPSQDTTRNLPHYLLQPTYTHAYTRPTDGPTDLSPASLIPRQESWGLTHWLGDSHGSHLCVFVCVRPAATACTAPYSGSAPSSSSSSSTTNPQHTHRHTTPHAHARTHTLPPFLSSSPSLSGARLTRALRETGWL